MLRRSDGRYNCYARETGITMRLHGTMREDAGMKEPGLPCPRPPRRCERLVIAALIVLLTGALGGCGVLLTSYADLTFNDKDNDLTELAPESDVFLVEMARK